MTLPVTSRTLQEGAERNTSVFAAILVLRECRAPLSGTESVQPCMYSRK